MIRFVHVQVSTNVMSRLTIVMRTRIAPIMVATILALVCPATLAMARYVQVGIMRGLQGKKSRRYRVRRATLDRYLVVIFTLWQVQYLCCNSFQ